MNRLLSVLSVSSVAICILQDINPVKDAEKVKTC